jgi:hypothetical protein
MKQEEADRLSESVTQGSREREKNVKYQLCQNVA